MISGDVCNQSHHYASDGPPILRFCSEYEVISSRINHLLSYHRNTLQLDVLESALTAHIEEVLHSKIIQRPPFFPPTCAQNYAQYGRKVQFLLDVCRFELWSEAQREPMRAMVAIMQRLLEDDIKGWLMERLCTVRYLFLSSHSTESLQVHSEITSLERVGHMADLVHDIAMHLQHNGKAAAMFFTKIHPSIDYTAIVSATISEPVR